MTLAVGIPVIVTEDYGLLPVEEHGRSLPGKTDDILTLLETGEGARAGWHGAASQPAADRRRIGVGLQGTELLA